MASKTKPPVHPPLDRNLVETIAFHEKHNADFPMFVFSHGASQDATEITYSQFAKAARRVPAFLGIEAKPPTRPVVAMIAQADTLVYKAVEMGMMIAGLVPFPISPRNTAAAVINLLKKTSCHHLVTTTGTLKDLIESVQAELKEIDPNYELIIKEIPTISQVLPELSGGVKNGTEEALVDYPDVTQQPNPDDIAIYLHSSGSTGLPKAIGKTHRQLEHLVAFPSFVPFKEYSPRVRMLGVQLPAFHAMGLCIQLVLPLYLCVTIAIFPPVVTSPHMVPMAPTPDSILDHTERTKATCTLTIPAFLQIWSQDKRALEILSGMDYVSFGGGGISPQAGAILRENGVRLHCSYGGTEFGAIGTSSLKPEDEDDWEYIEFSDICTPRWIPQGDGTYELQFLSNPKHSLSVENLEDARGYGTSDLFKPHPTKPNLWKIVGRVDDVIIHSSGEKTVPAPMEALMASSPQIMGAVMFGQGYDQPGVLIEPTEAYEVDASDQAQVANFRNLVWPTVEKANHIAPAFSKIFKEMILVADKNKPLTRAGKGTILKKAALILYANEIEELYKTVASVEVAEHIDPPKVWDQAGVSQWITEHAHDLTNGKTINKAETLFEQGLDSLGATILRRRIAGALQSAGDVGKKALSSVSQTLIYNYPSVDALSARIIELLSDPNAAGSSKTPVELIEEMISKYSFSGEIVNANRKDEGTVVILTGSTGYLGSQLLEGLLLDERISKVYAVNRPGRDGDSVTERHLKRFREKGLDDGLLTSPKLTCLETDASAENLGLPESTYAELSASANVIIHNAWRLDFNLSLVSFESNIRGTYNLIKLARSGGHAKDVKFIFTSSVGIAQSWDQSAGPYPEEILTDAKYAAGSGYGESKYVVERVLTTSGINFAAVRLGQIAGSDENGAWATSDWVPILVKSSIGLGALPTAEGTITWIPTNYVAGSLLDLAFSNKKYPPALNLVHHNPVEWNSTIKYIKQALEKECKVSLPFIPYQEWVAKVSQLAVSANSEQLKAIPAIKLLGFFESLAAGERAATPNQTEAFGTTKFTTNKLKVISKTFSELPHISSEHAYAWVKYWNSAGLFA
ncbi:putative aminoadipate reductase [Pholiota conissans]|uniref:Aminoadipate reductase n=1 Tax=Pholiota conissans TaxID=109636 RepID=A0A9P5YZQ6_9AGAR|nr:putative aminoadipate reductase [Pholiota conissans]